MAEAAVAEDLADGEGKAAPKSRKKLLIYGGAGLALIGFLAGGYFMFFKSKPADKQQAVVQLPTVYYELPEMTVNLSATSERPQYLRVKVTLEMADTKTQDAVKTALPRVVDAFQVHLRELRAVDLEGSAGLYRLREELTRRINLAIAPAKIRAVLFKEVVVQ